MLIKGPTIFPVLYALVVGGAVRSLALSRLQTGESVGFLDLLLGSTSVGNTIATQFERSLRRVDFATACLLILWALSPLGGQASFRIINYQDVPVVQNQTLKFLDFSNATYPPGLSSGDLGSLLDAIDPAFLATIVSPLSIQQSFSDSWGNIKIPAIESLAGYISTRENEWIPYPGYSEATPYASLIGIPISNIPSTGTTEFSLETAYWDLRCLDFGQPEQYDDDYWWEKISAAKAESCDFSQAPCLISDLLLPDGSSGNGVVTKWGWILSRTSDDDVTRRCRAEATDEVPERQLFYRSYNSGSAEHEITAANCTIRTTYVEAQLNCNGWDCKVDRLRRSQKRQTRPSSAYTIFDFCTDLDWTGSVNSFLNYFIDTADHQLKRVYTPGLLQGYIASPDRPFPTGLGESQRIDLTNIGNETFALRFSQLLNTYWSAVYNFNLTYANHPQGTSFASGYYQSLDPFTDVAGTNTHLESRFVYNRGWMTVLVLSTSAMFVSCVVKLSIDLKIWIPDLLMNVSTMLRGSMSRYTGIPYGGSAFDDSDRSRLLKDRMVRFGDIKAGDEYAGELGIGEIIEDGGGVAKVRRDKRYW